MWNIKVSTYKNNRMCITLYQKKRKYELSLDLEDAFIQERHIFLNPDVEKNGLLKVLKKYRIIKNIDGVLYYNCNSIPIAMLNTGILRNYDKEGTIDALDKMAIGGDK